MAQYAISYIIPNLTKQRSSAEGRWCLAGQNLKFHYHILSQMNPILILNTTAGSLERESLSVRETGFQMTHFAQFMHRICASSPNNSITDSNSSRAPHYNRRKPRQEGLQRSDVSLWCRSGADDCMVTPPWLQCVLLPPPVRTRVIAASCKRLIPRVPVTAIACTCDVSVLCSVFERAEKHKTSGIPTRRFESVLTGLSLSVRLFLQGHGCYRCVNRS